MNVAVYLPSANVEVADADADALAALADAALAEVLAALVLAAEALADVLALAALLLELEVQPARITRAHTTMHVRIMVTSFFIGPS